MVTVTSSGNTAVKAARRLLRRHGRDAADEFLVEGPALREAGGALRRVFVGPGAREASPDVWAAVEAELARRVDDEEAQELDVVEVSEQVLRDLAPTVTAQGMVGVAQLPRPSLDGVLADVARRGRGTGRLLVADGVADPGNAGTLVRTADAAGFDGVVFTTGSVDPRNAKTVRATAGSIFHLPVADRVDAPDLVAAAPLAGLRLVGAAAGAGPAHTDVDLSDGIALVLGNEAHGLSPVLAGSLEETVAIPMLGAPRPGHAGVAESLNLAVSAGVLMYESVRQATRSGSAADRDGAPGVAGEAS